MLNQMEKARSAEESVSMSLQHVAEPRPIRMVLVDDEESRVITQRVYERPRVLQPIAERLLTNDVDACLRGSEAVLAMQPRRREDVDELQRGFARKQIVEGFVDARVRCELFTAVLSAIALRIDERHDLDLGNPIPPSQVKFRNHPAADDRSAQLHRAIVALLVACR